MNVCAQHQCIFSAGNNESNISGTIEGCNGFICMIWRNRCSVSRSFQLSSLILVPDRLVTIILFSAIYILRRHLLIPSKDEISIESESQWKEKARSCPSRLQQLLPTGAAGVRVRSAWDCIHQVLS